MKVLWITDSLLPEAKAAIRNEEVKQWNTTGSWILSAAAELSHIEGVELTMLAVLKEVKGLTRVQTGHIVSYAIPYGKGHFEENHDYDQYMEAVRDEVQPDIVHIHGTEFSHSLSWLRICGSRHAVISIQGMTSVYANYYHAGMSYTDILRNISFRDIIRGGILREEAAFRRRGKFEIEMISTVRHIIGRTEWDYSHVRAINPKVKYHYGGETLRQEFYTGEKWRYTNCHPHSIFLSQAFSPLKGLHQLLKAMPLLLRDFPDTEVVVAGRTPINDDKPGHWWRITGYGRYVKRLIRMYGLQQHITFIGPQNAEEMKAQLLRSNVFLSASSIENSPNSLGEAQILGVPCVASYVGGVPEMMRCNEENLYRFDDVEMLAEKLRTVFISGDRQEDLSTQAALRHDPKKNVRELLETYHDILNEKTAR